MILALCFALVFAPAALLLLQSAEVPPDLLQTVSDALGMHTTAGYVIAGLLAVLILLPLVLKALGKNIPLLDAGVSFLLGVLKSLVKKREAEVVKADEAEKAKEPGVSNAVKIREEE